MGVMEYCHKCKKQTQHKIISQSSDRQNKDLECTVCGERKFLMQGFDYNLM